jgi:hypothetical protein
VKKKETNWALFAEWTCRDQLKKLRAEEEDAAKSKGISAKGEVDSEKECQLGKENCCLREQVLGSSINCAGQLPHRGHKISFLGKIAMSIANGNIAWRRWTESRLAWMSTSRFFSAKKKKPE